MKKHIVRLTPAMRVRARLLRRGVLSTSLAMLGGSLLLGATILTYGAPIGDTLVDLGLRLRSAGTRPIYLLSSFPPADEDARIRAIVTEIAAEEVRTEVTSLLGPESIRVK